MDASGARKFSPGARRTMYSTSAWTVAPFLLRRKVFSWPVVSCTTVHTPRLGGGLINSGAWPETMKGQEAFRERVFKSFKEDFLNRQPEARRERLNRVINFLSFVSPTPRTDALFNRAA